MISRNINPQLFKVGDIIGNRLDGNRIVYKVTVRYGEFIYDTFRTHPVDIAVNGKTARYSQTSLRYGSWKLVGFAETVELLYGTI